MMFNKRTIFPVTMLVHSSPKNITKPFSNWAYRNIRYYSQWLSSATQKKPTELNQLIKLMSKLWVQHNKGQHPVNRQQKGPKSWKALWANIPRIPEQSLFLSKTFYVTVWLQFSCKDWIFFSYVCLHPTIPDGLVVSESVGGSSRTTRLTGPGQNRIKLG